MTTAAAPISQINPRPSRAHAASNPEQRDIHEDVAMCYERLGIEDTCLCSRASCFHSMRERYQTLNKELAEAAKRAGRNERLLTAFKFALDLLGLIPGIGMVFDLISAAINAFQRKWLNMVFALLSAIPLGGQVFTAAKFALKGSKALSAVAPLANRVFAVVKRVAGSKKLRAILRCAPAPPLPLSCCAVVRPSPHSAAVRPPRSSIADRVKNMRLTNVRGVGDEVGKFAGDVLQASHTLRRAVGEAGNLRRVLKSSLSNDRKLAFVQTQVRAQCSKWSFTHTHTLLLPHRFFRPARPRS